MKIVYRIWSCKAKTAFKLANLLPTFQNFWQGRAPEPIFAVGGGDPQAILCFHSKTACGTLIKILNVIGDHCSTRSCRVWNVWTFWTAQVLFKDEATPTQPVTLLLYKTQKHKKRVVSWSGYSLGVRRWLYNYTAWVRFSGLILRTLTYSLFKAAALWKARKAVGQEVTDRAYKALLCSHLRMEFNWLNYHSFPIAIIKREM